jgi:hypothetical protein
VNADNGKKCHRPADRCQVGECQNGTCVQDDPNGWDEKCPEVDGNVCTRECQVVSNVPQCLQNGVNVPNTCFILQGNSCQAGQCASGSCVPNGTPANNCTDPIPQCHARACTPQGECDTTPTPGVLCTKQSGPFPGECEFSQCSKGGDCKNVDKTAGTDCTETGLCRDAGCDGNGNCEQSFHAQNTPCASDTNSCTNQVCNTSGSCLFGSCESSAVECEFCAAGGVPGVMCQNSVPNNLNCGCQNL